MDRTPHKVCFVTIGATAPFDALLSKVLDQPFLEALSKNGYTKLLIQYGKEGRVIFDNYITKFPTGNPERYGLDIQGFDFKKDGLLPEMRSTKSGDKLDVVEGMILSHAGTFLCTLDAIFCEDSHPNLR
jgi:beta-1,4-N-acetylglucosaminyltransferase